MGIKLSSLVLLLFLLAAGSVQARTLDVIATSYCACKVCTGKSPVDKGYGITASGKPAQAGMIAVDKKLIKLGTRVRIGKKTYLAADTGSAIKGRRIDVYMSSHQAALEFGRQKLCIEF